MIKGCSTRRVWAEQAAIANAVSMHRRATASNTDSSAYHPRLPAFPPWTVLPCMQVSKGEGDEPLYIVQCDLAGRTMNVVNPAGETCIFIQKRHAAHACRPQLSLLMLVAVLSPEESA